MINQTSRKLKTFTWQKMLFKTIKRRATDWEKTFINHISNKERVSSMQKSLENSIFYKKKTNNPIRKSVQDMNRCFTEKDIETANKHTKRCSASLTIREMQMKTTQRQGSTSIRIAKTKNSDGTKCWQGSGEAGSFTYCWQLCKMVQPRWKTVWQFRDGQQISDNRD